MERRRGFAWLVGSFDAAFGCFRGRNTSFFGRGGASIWRRTTALTKLRNKQGTSGKNETGVTDDVGCVSGHVCGGGVADEFDLICAEFAQSGEGCDRGS
jgi:hypothetical protein